MNGEQNCLIKPSSFCPFPAGSPGSLSDIDIAIIFIVLISVFVLVCLLVCLIIYVPKKWKSSTRTAHDQSARDRMGPDDHPYDQPWQLINQIGQGRYGYVYKAQFEGDIVAVKIFSHNCRTAWETECTLNSMESTAHKNIVEFIGKGSRGSGISLQLYVISRYYPLGSLNQFLRKRVVTLEQACVIIRDIAEGLAHLHSEYYTNSGGIVAEKYAIAHR